MTIREVQSADLPQLLTLYTHLHDNPLPAMDDNLTALWHTILNDPNHHILVGLLDNQIVSNCVLLIIPNLTHNQQPYALIENVITHPSHRNRGYAAQLLNHAKNIALDSSCYKIMLLTGAKNDKTLRFYRRAGYSSKDKTAFIQWLD